MGGEIKIDRYSQGKFFKPFSDINVKFFHMEQLKTFDAIVGHDTLKELGAIINVPKEVIILPNKTEIPLHNIKFNKLTRYK